MAANDIIKKNINYKELMDKEITQIFHLFFFASLLLLLSGLRVDQIIHYYFAPGHILVYFILGLLHAMVDLLYFVLPRINLIIGGYNEKEKYTVAVFEFFCTIFLYTGVYQSIMLPPFGLGVVEFLAIAVFLGLLLWSVFTKKTGSRTKPQWIVGLLLLIFLIKVLSFFTPENSFSEFIDGKPAARNLIVFTFIITGYLAVFRKQNIVSGDKMLKAAGKAGKIIAKIAVWAAKLLIKLINIILSLLTGPALIITLVAIVALILIFPFFGIGIIDAFIESHIMKLYDLISSFLRPLCSTGKYAANPNALFCIIQIIIISIYILYWVSLYHVIDTKKSKDLISNYIAKQNEDNPEYDEKTTQKYISDINIHNKTDKIFNADNICFSTAEKPSAVDNDNKDLINIDTKE